MNAGKSLAEWIAELEDEDEDIRVEAAMALCGFASRGVDVIAGIDSLELIDKLARLIDGEDMHAGRYALDVFCFISARHPALRACIAAAPKVISNIEEWLRWPENEDGLDSEDRASASALLEALHLASSEGMRSAPNPTPVVMPFLREAALGPAAEAAIGRKRARANAICP